MEREADKRLEELKASGKTVYSISRLDAINRCLYEAYITYVLGERGGDNVYSALGGRTHDVLEGITNGTCTEADLLPAMQEELDNLDVLGLQFPKDRSGNDTIRQHWIQDMTHFCETYQAPRGKNLKAEELIIYETPSGNYLQGYIDLQNIRKDGSIDIYDYKTSSMYTGDAIAEHARQLIVYALGLEQAGKKVNSASWIFLKYAAISYMGKKTSRSNEEILITKNLERCKIGQEMADRIELDLIKTGMDELDAQIIVDRFKKSGKFDILPEEIRDNYKVRPCVISADIDEDAKKECIEYIDSTIAMWESLGGKSRDYPPRKFTETRKNGKEVESIFFCTNLCPHFKRCEYIRDYLDQKSTIQKSENGDDDLF